MGIPAATKIAIIATSRNVLAHTYVLTTVFFNNKLFLLKK